MSEQVETVDIKYYYGTDSVGFFWANSAQKRKDAQSVRRNAPSEFEATYQGRPGRRIGRIFKSEDFVFYEPPDGLADGINDPFVARFVAQGFAVFQAWDTAFSTSAEAAHTVCVTGMFVPCNRFHRDEGGKFIGECEDHYDVVILDVFRDKLDWGDLLNAVKRQYYKWQPQSVIIEKRATGISLVQTLGTSNIPILGIEVGSASKGERALNRVDARSAGSVQGWCRQHRVQFPAHALWLDAFTAELKDFSGDNDSSADQVDAFVHLTTHAIRMGSTNTLLPTGFTLDAFEAASNTTFGSTDDLNGMSLQYIGGMEEYAYDPYAGMCGRCRNFIEGHCEIQRRSVIAFDSCGEFEAKPN